jgi:glucose-1-phosphate adenylyltransferase
VFQNLPLIRFGSAEHVVIASGDHVYSMDYRRLLARHIVSGAAMTIAAVRRPVSQASAFGVLDVGNGMVTGFREKPSPETLPQTGEVLVSMGIYVFTRRVLLDIADRASAMQTDFGKDIIPGMIRGSRAVAAYDFSSAPRNYWRDVGSLDSYFEANMDLLGARPEFHPEVDTQWPFYARASAVATKTEDSRISPRAVVGRSEVRHSVIAHGSCVEPGAVVEHSVVLPGARVGANARLRNAIVAEGATVSAGDRIGMDVSADRNRFMVTPGGVVVIRPLDRQVRWTRYTRPNRYAYAVA